MFHKRAAVIVMKSCAGVLTVTPATAADSASNIQLGTYVMNVKRVRLPRILLCDLLMLDDEYTVD